MFSVLFSLNIAIGNLSLRYVSVSFNQVSRALVPVVVMIISIMYFGKGYSTERKISVLPIVLGAAMTVYGEMSYSTIGAMYTFACVILAALKAVVSGELLTGELKLHPVDLLLKMCPLALIQIGLGAILSGEVGEIWEHRESLLNSAAPIVVLFSGLLSFLLNVSSFIANKSTSALTLCICANVKQVLLAFVGTLYFGDSVSMLNGVGILIACAGSFRYSMVSIAEREEPAAKATKSFSDPEDRSPLLSPSTSASD
jgi:drug/metabolite transporter (DMT)-like permease